jgi:A/G-specific adenine glycosylase
MSRYIPNFAAALIHWHQTHGRHHLPWKKNMTPYRIWVSEIMLQQTQVATVVPYFERFVTHFPTLQDLASAALDEVLIHWAGLGYYSRAKNLHQTAQIIVHEHHGRFPNTLETLTALPGIGRSTAGAVLVFAYGQKAAILDGNVKRIFIRLHHLEMSTQDRAAEKILWPIAEHYLPNHHIQSYTQSLMDLGASVCLRRRPLCQKCPLSNQCLAYQHNATDRLPLPKKQKKLPLKKVFFLMIQNQDKHILLVKRPPVGIWSNLWSVPELSKLSELTSLSESLSLNSVQIQKKLPVFKHTFTHFQLEITPLISQCDPSIASLAEKKQTWVSQSILKNYGMPKPVDTLLHQLFESPI